MKFFSLATQGKAGYSVPRHDEQMRFTFVLSTVCCQGCQYLSRIGQVMLFRDSLLAAEVMQSQTNYEEIVLNDESRRICTEVIKFYISHYFYLHLDQLV